MVGVSVLAVNVLWRGTRTVSRVKHLTWKHSSKRIGCSPTSIFIYFNFRNSVTYFETDSVFKFTKLCPLLKAIKRHHYVLHGKRPRTTASFAMQPAKRPSFRTTCRHFCHMTMHISFSHSTHILRGDILFCLRITRQSQWNNFKGQMVKNKK